MYELTDIILDRSNGFRAIVLNIYDMGSDYGDGMLIGYLENNNIADDIDGNIHFISKLQFNTISFYRKPNFEELKQYVTFKNYLLNREIKIFEENPYKIDTLISNIKEF